MITAYATFETAVQATKLGAYDFLPKPFSPEELRYSLRKATDQLIISREARRLAEEERQVRFNFISVLSHELKAPLNAIEGYLKILQDDEAARAPADDRPQPHPPGRHAQAHLRPPRPHPHRVGAEGPPVRRGRRGGRRPEDHRPLRHRGRRAQDQHHARAPQPVKMMADAGELEIVLNNLVSNAVKYNRDGGSVTVALERKDDTVKHPGGRHRHRADPEESAKLFSEFVRIKNEDTFKILGSGLGLSTVRKLAHLYGGDATVKSEKGVGSIFTVTLRDAAPDRRARSPPTTRRLPTRRGPRSRRSAPSAARYYLHCPVTPRQCPHDPAGHRRTCCSSEGVLQWCKILIVDDDPDMVEASRIVLERDGYSVESASNLEDGLQKLAETKPDLLILDVMMEEPDDGLRFARQVRRDGQHAPHPHAHQRQPGPGAADRQGRRDGPGGRVRGEAGRPRHPRRPRSRRCSTREERRHDHRASRSSSATRSSASRSTPTSAAPRSSPSSATSRRSTAASTARPCR